MPPEQPCPTSRPYRNQIIGMLIGGVFGALLITLIPSIRKVFDELAFVLLSAGIGSALASLDRFERAGWALTHRENRKLNLAIGLSIPVILLGVVIFLLFR